MGLFLLLVCQWSIVLTFVWIIEDLVSLYDGDEPIYAWKYPTIIGVISFLIICARVENIIVF